MNWRVETTKHFVKTMERLDDGTTKKVSRMVRHINLFVRDPLPITDSGFYRISLVKRKGMMHFAVFVLATKTDLILRKQDILDEYKRQDTLYTVEELINWLKPRLGKQDAENALIEFLGS